MTRPDTLAFRLLLSPVILAVPFFLFGLCGGRAAASAAPSKEANIERVYGTAPRDDAASSAAFHSILAVIHHPRCMNCHSKGDFPRQGDDGHPHAMNVRRGQEGLGVTAQKCGTCHQTENVAGPHRPPGAPTWHLPPASMPMIWQGLTDRQICEQIKDPKQNGGRSVDRIVDHLTHDKLVAWGWNPGEERSPAPIPHDQFSELVKEWAAKGASCPAE